MKNQKKAMLSFIKHFLFCLFTAILLSGCAGQTARQVARLELAQVVSYEQELDVDRSEW